MSIHANIISFERARIARALFGSNADAHPKFARTLTACIIDFLADVRIAEQQALDTFNASPAEFQMSDAGLDFASDLNAALREINEAVARLEVKLEAHRQ